ncbi:MAG: hypothetical protein ACO3Y3_10515 [Phycisphaerales bacterium]|jgi:hypothetical protein
MSDREESSSAADRFSAVRGAIECPEAGPIGFGALGLRGWIATSTDAVPPAVLLDGRRIEAVEWMEGAAGIAVAEGERLRRWSALVELTPEQASPDGIVRVELRQHDSVAARRFFRLPHEALPARPPITLFMHIPKCAGTTLRVQLERAIGFPRFRPIYPPRMHGVSLESLAGEIDDRCEVAYGHFWHGLHRHLDRPARAMTVLRDPLELILSQYFFAKYRLRSPAFASCETIEQALERHPATFDNVMTRWLGGDPLAPRADEALLARAIAAIDADFAWVGFVEHLADACGEIAARLGVAIDASVHNDSPRTTERAMLDLAAFRAAARPFVDLDMRLYAHARLRTHGSPVIAG